VLPGSAPIAIVLLAAGFSRRFGAEDKLAAMFQGRAVLRHVVNTAIASDAGPVLVVTRPDASVLRRYLEGAGVCVVENREAEEGIASSVRAGIAVVPPGCRGAAILPGDMVWMRADLISELAAEFLRFDADRIVVPVTPDGDARNPVIWPRAVFEDLLRLRGDVGGKPLLARHTALITRVTVNDTTVFRDVDTPEDLELPVDVQRR